MEENHCLNASILITNDDGVTSPGLKLLYESVKNIGRVEIIAPKTSRSACGHGMTLHKSIRASRITLWGSVHAIAIDGLPTDAVYIALSHNRPDIVLSGINLGDNTSLQSILASSTIGAVIHAALNGVPGVAFSIEIRDENELHELSEEYLAFIKKLIRKLTESILCSSIPGYVDALSVNFPRRLRGKEVYIARPATLRFRQRAELVERNDNEQYYRLIGAPTNPPPNSDAGLLLQGHVVITPLCLEYIGQCSERRLYWLARALSSAIEAPVKI